jgi:hypothetical protein
VRAHRVAAGEVGSRVCCRTFQQRNSGCALKAPSACVSWLRSAVLHGGVHSAGAGVGRERGLQARGHFHRARKLRQERLGAFTVAATRAVRAYAADALCAALRRRARYASAT